MKGARLCFLCLSMVVPASVVGAESVTSACQIADAKLEEAIAKKRELRAGANAQVVRDLRTLRDAAVTLQSYKHDGECERVVAIIRELIADPDKAIEASGDTDEDKAEEIAQATKPKTPAAKKAEPTTASVKAALPLGEVSPRLRADEILGAEVRSSDNKRVGEVKNIVFGAKGQPDYAVVAYGGFLTGGSERIAVPLDAFKVATSRETLVLSLSQSELKTVPVITDRDYKWVSDDAWRTKNDLVFAKRQ